VNSLVFDCANFDTFTIRKIPANSRGAVTPKSKRSDLRIVGLALLVTSTFMSPCCGRFTPAITRQRHLCPSLARTHPALSGLGPRMPVHHLVFDKGNNSAAIKNSSTTVISTLSAPWYDALCRLLALHWRNFSLSKTAPEPTAPCAHHARSGAETHPGAHLQSRVAAQTNSRHPAAPGKEATGLRRAASQAAALAKAGGQRQGL